MRKPTPGNRVLVGDSGVEFEVPENVASGLVNSHKARYADGLGNHKKGNAAVAAAPAVTENGREDESVDLEKLSITQLREIADERGIDLGDAAKKADIVEVIYAALESDDEE